MLLDLKRRARRFAAWLKQDYRPILKKLAIAASAIVAVLLIWAALWALREIPTWQVNELLKPAGDGSARLVLDKEKAELFQVENEARRTLTQIILGVFGLLALVFLGVRSWANYKDSRTAEQGQITDRFNKAIELLGATHEKGEPKLEIRLGAIYALERIARDTVRDHWPVMEVLTAYVRENADWKEPKAKDVETPSEEKKKSEDKFKPRIDIQAILTVLGRRERSKAGENDKRLDLSNTDLRGASLVETHLEGAVLWDALLELAFLHDAHLERANLDRAHLEAASAKNAKQRHVPLTARAVAMLKGLGPQKEGVVFHRADGQPLYQTWLNEKHRKLRKTLKLPADFVPHSFRHTYGTRLGEAGADAFTIMRLMGHSTVVVSQKYVHPTPETMESAVRRMAALNPNRSSGVPLNPPLTDSVAKTYKALTS